MTFYLAHSCCLHRLWWMVGQLHTQVTCFIVVSSSGPPAAPNPAPNSSPPPSPPPSPSPPPPPAPNAPAPTPASPFPPRKSKIGIISGGVIGGVGGIVILLICCKIFYRVFHPILIYIAHSSGENEITKNFAESLSEDLKSTWRYKFHIIKVFFDKRSLPPGEHFPAELLGALQETGIGVVVVTDDFFRRKWPMTELISFTDSKTRKGKKVKIYPLFYRLTVNEVKDRLGRGTWDGEWAKMANPDENHPLDFQECKNAVKSLSEQQGIIIQLYYPG